jgi:16S rRNA (guanine966-N2)-methyltransferase
MKPGTIRIIAGKWRSRRLQVMENASLRPTPNRVRETLFNWLNSTIYGARCLDLFAGSGALGFEAASRGASYVEMVDEAESVIHLLKAEAKHLEAETVYIYRATVPAGLKVPDQPFNIVFLDPPFSANILLPTCHYLESAGFLAPDALIYLESQRALHNNELPTNWQLIKAKKAGQVFYHLALRKMKA